MGIITFEKLPEAVADLREQISEIKTILEQTRSPIKDNWMDLNELIEYDPEKRSKPTFYGYTRDAESGFPFHKRGKRILVLKSEFDEWLRNGKIKSKSDLLDEVDDTLSNCRKSITKEFKRNGN